jgi:hypothetical protein
LLEGIYDLAGGYPGRHVDTVKAAENAEIPNTVQDLDPICRYLKNDEGCIDSPYAGFGVVTITPVGIDVVREQRGPSYLA